MIQNLLRPLTLVLFLAGLPCAAEIVLLRLTTLHGEGSVFAAGARSILPLTVQVTDQTGRPVEAAAVSFLLPDEEASGVLPDGLRNAIVLTDPAGRASVRDIRWGPVPGPVRVRVTAAKDSARAGTVINLYVSQAVAMTDTPPGGIPGWSGPRRPGKWKWILAAAGAAAGGLAAGRLRSARPASAAATVALPAVQVGPPVITVGQP